MLDTGVDAVGLNGRKIQEVDLEFGRMGRFGWEREEEGNS